MMIYLIPTSTAEHLAKGVNGRKKGFETIFPDLSKNKKRYFPNGEVYMKISPKFLSRFGGQKKRVIVLHSGAPRPNEGLIELELILQILRDNKIKPEVFFSYFPYGMQDEVFGKGETNVAENLAEKLVNYYKVKKIYVIDAHFGGRKWIKKYPIKNISAIPILIERAKKDFGKDILLLSPDLGGRRRTGISGMKKERVNSYQVKITSLNINLKGKTVGVIDDIIKTGGTLLKFYEIAKKSGAKKIIALVTHGVMPDGILKIKKKYFKVYLTNTIDQRNLNIDLIDITDLILKTISAN